MAHQLHTIKSQDDCSEFLGWLEEHPEVTGVQGYKLIRRDGKRVVSFSYGDGEHYAMATWMYSERKVLNDWIKTYISRNGKIEYGWWNTQQA